MYIVTNLVLDKFYEGKEQGEMTKIYQCQYYATFLRSLSCAQSNTKMPKMLYPTNNCPDH